MAAIPFLGYITVFVYELGFLTYFGIPYEFIQLTFTGVCLVTAVIIGVLLFSFVSGHCFTLLLTTIFPIKEGPFLRAIYKENILASFCAVVFCYLLGQRMETISRPTNDFFNGDFL